MASLWGKRVQYGFQIKRVYLARVGFKVQRVNSISWLSLLQRAQSRPGGFKPLRRVIC